MSVRMNVSEDNFSAEVLESDVPVLVDFYADWAVSRMQAPALEELAAELGGRVKFVRLNVDHAPRLARRYGVWNLPTVGVFAHGGMVRRLFGLRRKPEWRAVIESALAPRPRATRRLFGRSVGNSAPAVSAVSIR